MKIQISKAEVEAASDMAIILREGSQAFVVERQSDGGVIHCRATETHECYPVSLVKNGESFVPAGDWTVVPYVKNRKNGENLYGQDGTGFQIDWID